MLSNSSELLTGVSWVNILAKTRQSIVSLWIIGLKWSFLCCEVLTWPGKSHKNYIMLHCQYIVYLKLKPTALLKAKAMLHVGDKEVASAGICISSNHSHFSIPEIEPEILNQMQVPTQVHEFCIRLALEKPRLYFRFCCQFGVGSSRRLQLDFSLEIKVP